MSGRRMFLVAPLTGVLLMALNGWLPEDYRAQLGMWALLGAIGVALGAVVWVAKDPIKQVAAANPRTFIAAGSVVGAIGCGFLAWLVTREAVPNIPATESSSDVMLVAPTNYRLYRWVPSEWLSIRESDTPTNTGKLTMFQIRNFSGRVLTGIVLDWAIADPKDIRSALAASSVFEQFKPEIKLEGMTSKLSLSRPETDRRPERGMAMPIGDAATTTIEFCESVADAFVPIAIGNSYAVRLVIRGPRTNRTVAGPVIRVTLAYQSGGKKYVNKFRIDSEVLTFSDQTSFGAIDNVQPADRSPGNYRARVQFRVHRED